MRIVLWIIVLIMVAVAPNLTYGCSLEEEAIAALETMVKGG
jgi:hypothetical protein